MKAIYKACALAALGLACSAPAMAGEYVIGGALGRARLDADAPAGYTNDRSDSGYKIYGGLKVASELSVEASYWDLGSASAKRGALSQRTSTTAFGFGLAFKPVIADQFFGIGRAGLAQVRSKFSSSTAGRSSENNIRAYFGVGAGYAVTPQFDVQATWDFMQSEYRGQGRRVDLFALGVSYTY